MSVELKEEIDRVEILMDIGLWEISEINLIEWIEEMVNIAIITKEIMITKEEMIIRWGKEQDPEMIIILVLCKTTKDHSLVDTIQDPRIKITLEETNIRVEISIENTIEEGMSFQNISN